MPTLTALLTDIRACTLCVARLLIAGQAPGRKVNETGVPFNDASGERLRAWLGLSREEFYDARQVAIVPMGFCYPGTGPSGDLPPRPECAPAWRTPLLAHLKHIELTLAVGRYAQAWHLPHPSPRNNGWLKRNPWFEEELLPLLRARVQEVLGVCITVKETCSTP
jgi:uracil-DNA glycosylase